MYTFETNRVVRDTGATYPVCNAPIGRFARSGLAGAVAAAGGIGLLETVTTDLAGTAAEFERIRAQTDGPIGIQLLIRVLTQQGRLEEVLEWALSRSPLVISAVGDPGRIVARIHEAGAKLYHQTGSVEDAERAVESGADGLIVEGAESGGLRSERSLHLFSLLQQVRARVDVLIIAAGGIADGHGMAGAFALGAEGIMMGTRFISAVEAPAHVNFKQAITDAQATISLEPVKKGIKMRFVRNDFSEAVARGDIDPQGNVYAGPVLELFDHGRLDKAMVGAGESAVLISEVRSVADIMDETIDGFWQEMQRLAGLLR